MEEIWKDIQGYEGLYQISNLGRVKSLGRIITNKIRTYYREDLILSPGKDKDGYFQVQLYKNGINKMRKVHRLVAETFILNPNNYPCINHKDENKQNNHVSNLEWCTVKYNQNYGTRTERAAEKRRGCIGLVGEKNPMYGRTGEKHPLSRKVICLNNLKIFNSIKEASEYANVANIRSCLCGKSNYCGKIDNIKLVWEYYDNYLKMTDEEIKEKIDKSTRRKTRKRKNKA